MKHMARRGDQLRDHILWAAKDVFLETGFERASMDQVASRAATSKRSLYAHFENKEKLFLAVITMVRGLFLDRVQVPESFSENPTEALVLFCCRYLEVLLYQSQIRMIRISTFEAERFPDQASDYFDVLFVQMHGRISTYLCRAFTLSKRDSDDAAHRLLGELLYPKLLRALFGLEHLATSLSSDTLPKAIDHDFAREVVNRLLKSLPNGNVKAQKRTLSNRQQPTEKHSRKILR